MATKESVVPENYIFFLHNKFLETHELDQADPQFGKVEYLKIIGGFKKDGFIVLSEKRKPQTDVKSYAKKVVSQIDSLFELGVNPKHITVIGTSKGGYIAQYVSTYLAHPNVNYVLIGAFQDNDITEIPDIQLCGNILNIYEKTDSYGVSMKKKIARAPLKVKHFEEIELHTGLRHGFLYRAMDQWMVPCKRWARQDYALAK
ncbi:alpha/beta hydrolase [Flavobacterium sp.]|uniref:alpha/beta hydrolase n=1 Tax=Flavobacterium sp. TaxID=239 RepID=UPI0039E276DC